MSEQDENDIISHIKHDIDVALAEAGQDLVELLHQICVLRQRVHVGWILQIGNCLAHGIYRCGG